MRLARDGTDLIVAQGEMADAHLARFRRPADPKTLWTAEPIGTGLHFPHGLAVADLDGDGRNEIIAGENNGAASRLLIFTATGSHQTKAGAGIHAIFVTDLNGDGRPDVVVAGPRGVTWWENVPPVAK
jgi:hypothetical protein